MPWVRAAASEPPVGLMLCRQFPAAAQRVCSIRNYRSSAALPLDGLIAQPAALMPCRRCAATGQPVDWIRGYRCVASAPLDGSIPSYRLPAAALPVDRIRLMVFPNRSLDVLVARSHPNAVRPIGHAVRSVDPDQCCDLCCLGRLDPPDLLLRSPGELHSDCCPEGGPVSNPARGCRNPQCHTGAENQTVFEGP